VTLRKFCLFAHARSLIMLLSATFFTFIFPFEAQQCCAWILLGTNSMSCLTLLRLLDVCMWIFIYILFLAINTCCVKGWKVTHQIFLHKKDGFTISIVFISNVICFNLHCFVLCCYLLVQFPLVVWVSIFIFFVNTSLQQSTCIVFMSRIVGFALSSCSLLDHFPCCCLGFRFSISLKKIATIHLRWFTECTTRNMMNYIRNMFQLHVSKSL
jgi:hypothetical protein